MRKFLGLLALLTAAPAVVLAHHGWGSYDASRVITVQGPIETSSYTNPHATLTVKTAQKVWTVTLAPVSRMRQRGATAEFVAVGKRVRGWVLRSGAVPLDVTYRCSAATGARDDIAVDAALETLRVDVAAA